MNKEEFKGIKICNLILEELNSEGNKCSIAQLAKDIKHGESSLRKLLHDNNSTQTKLLFDISIVRRFDHFSYFSEILSGFSIEVPEIIMMNDETQICKLVHKILELRKGKRSVARLASEVYNNNRNSLNRLLKEDKNSIDTDVLFRISIALKFDFFSCFSKILSKYSPRKI